MCAHTHPSVHSVLAVAGGFSLTPQRATPSGRGPCQGHRSSQGRPGGLRSGSPASPLPGRVATEHPSCGTAQTADSCAPSALTGVCFFPPPLLCLRVSFQNRPCCQGAREAAGRGALSPPSSPRPWPHPPPSPCLTLGHSRTEHCPDSRVPWHPGCFVCCGIFDPG